MLCGDEIVRRTYQALRDAGREPGRDVAVIGTNDRPWCPHVSPTLTSIGMDLDTGAEFVCEELDRVSHGEPGTINTLTTTVHERESTQCSPPAS